MEKKITKKIRKAVAKCMSKPFVVVEVMRVPKDFGIEADAIYAVPNNAVYLTKIVVLDEDEKIDDDRLDRINSDLSIGVAELEAWGFRFNGTVYCTTACVWLRTDGSIAWIATGSELPEEM